MTQNIVYPRISLTGGTDGALDDIDGDILQNNDVAIVVTSTTAYLYHLNSTSGVAESSPDIIAPDLNPGAKRWELVALFVASEMGSHDDITATSDGVAASIETDTTFVTTNGDSDLDNVTLADGTEGQVKHICCVVEGNGADTWKITPANMVGGSQITFAGIGEGCILKMYSAGWIVVGNNGGTIS